MSDNGETRCPECDRPYDRKVPEPLFDPADLDDGETSCEGAYYVHVHGA